MRRATESRPLPLGVVAPNTDAETLGDKILLLLWSRCNLVMYSMVLGFSEILKTAPVFCNRHAQKW